MQMAAMLGDMLAPVITPDVAARLVALTADDRTSKRVLELGGKANDGSLTAAEREEYEAFVRANDVVAILQAKARQVLSQQGQ